MRKKEREGEWCWHPKEERIEGKKHRQTDRETNNVREKERHRERGRERERKKENDRETNLWERDKDKNCVWERERDEVGLIVCKAPPPPTSRSFLLPTFGTTFFHFSAKTSHFPIATFYLSRRMDLFTWKDLRTDWLARQLPHSKKS